MKDEEVEEDAVEKQKRRGERQEKRTVQIVVKDSSENITHVLNN